MPRSSALNFDAPPSEVMTQMLFVNYAQHLAKSLSKRIVLFAPTQPEEELTGYDASLIGGGCRELYLQFKRGKQESSTTDEIRFQVDNSPSRKAGTKQLDTLKRAYPPLSAYYVAGGFWDVRCALEAQKKITADDDFLDVYAAVSAHAIHLPSGQKSSQVCLGGRCKPCNRSTKYHVCMVQSKWKGLVHGADWFYGSELFHEFLTRGAASRVGCSIRVQRRQVVRIPTAPARQLAGDNAFYPIQPATDAVLAENRRIPRYRHSDSTPLLTVRVFDD